MKLQKSLVFTLILLVIALFIHIYSANSIRVENQYSIEIYPVFSRFLRYIFGWIPFSVGDLLYSAVVLWLIYKLVRVVKSVLKKQINWKNTGLFAWSMINTSLSVYIIFNLFWGINYNRAGIASQLGLKMDKYSQQDLTTVNQLLVEKVNTSKQALMQQQAEYPGNSTLFLKVQQAYIKAEKVYPFLNYKPVSLKPSLWSWLGNYMGFTGYYNPLTGEAQVNTLVPKFLQPFTACHEVAHQLGYAKENEANFVGYLSATASGDSLLQYSVYLDMFIYCNRNLYGMDSTSAKKYKEQLVPDVLADLKEWRTFNKNHRSPIEPVFKWIYGKYLQGNQQPQGVLSYDEVTGFIIAYYNKYGKL